MPYILLYLLLSFTSTIFATNIDYINCDKTNNTITEIIKQLDPNNLTSRIEYLSHQFIGKPYSFNALGEGQKGKFDQSPLYRVDLFDCETYVDTVLALALANDLSSFKQYINKIRYKNGRISFINRNHFTCLDWNNNNQYQGFVTDITKSITNKNNESIALIATADIDKPNWYKNMSDDRIHLPDYSEAEKEKRLLELRGSGKKLKKVSSSIPYIALADLFDNSGKPDMQLFKQIPSGAIIEIIRPNWDLYKEIGTNLNVSHLGFVIWENDIPYFLHSSSSKNAIVKTPLIPYLYESQKSPTIKGINIQTATNNHHQTNNKLIAQNS